MRESSKGLLFASTTALMWGILPFFLAPLFREVSVLSVIWFRFAFSFLFVLALLRMQGRLDWSRILRLHPSVWVAAMFLSFNYYGFSYGLSRTNPAAAQILIQSGPILFAVLSYFFFREHLKRIQVFGVLLALAGFGIFWKDQVKYLVAALADFNEGIIWIAAGGLSWGLYAIFLKRASRQHFPQEINLGIYLLSTLLFAPLAHYSDFRTAGLGAFALLVFAALNTVIAYGCMSEAIHRLSAAKVSLIVCLNPLLTLVIIQLSRWTGVTWTGTDRLHLGSWIGALFVVAGAVLVVRGREDLPVTPGEG